MEKVTQLLKNKHQDHIACANCGDPMKDETELDICSKCEEQLYESHDESDFIDESEEKELTGMKALIRDQELDESSVNEEQLMIIISALLPSFNIESTSQLKEEDKDDFWKEVDRLKTISNNEVLPQNEEELDEAYDPEISRIITSMLKLKTNCKNSLACSIITSAVDRLKAELKS